MQQVTSTPTTFHANRTEHDPERSWPRCQCGWYDAPQTDPATARRMWAEHAGQALTDDLPQDLLRQQVGQSVSASPASHPSCLGRGRGGRRTVAAVAVLLLAVLLSSSASAHGRQIAGSATVTAERVTVEHPKPPYLVLTGCELMKWHADQVGLPDEFGWIGLGESSCRNDVNTWCCWGYFQVHELHIGQPHTDHCDVAEIADMFGADPFARSKNACMAKAVFDLQGFCAWDVYKNRTGRCR